jgi:hypothetical protein
MRKINQENYKHPETTPKTNPLQVTIKWRLGYCYGSQCDLFWASVNIIIT